MKVRSWRWPRGPSGYESLLLPSALLAAHTTAGLPAGADRTSRQKVLGRLDLAKWPGATLGGRELLGEGYDAGLGVDA